MEKKMSFKEFYNAGAFLNTAQTGFDNQFFGIGHSLELPTPTLDLPTKQLGGRVLRINYTENPISVVFDNGAIWNMTKKQWDYLKSTNKEPRINSNMQIEMWLDGTIKSVDFASPSGVRLSEKNNPDHGKESNKKSLLGGKSKSFKPERTFGKPKPF